MAVSDMYRIAMKWVNALQNYKWSVYVYETISDGYIHVNKFGKTRMPW
jgi:hypothetical protein